MLNHKTTAALVAVIALAGPGPAALAQSPDAIDAAQGRYPGSSPAFQDLRSPDARDVTHPDAPSVTPSPIAQPEGFDWESAGIGAAAGTGLIVIALALATGGRRRTLLRQG